ncbi:transcription termination factor Rho [Mycolicibacterium litorale]|uniref:Transcription termination factor Rho n=1 Tax=Mycolicibacterium litorale TaxID=758802 RepID=A0AAD1IH37_9MYCO|nr:transcription termination factor Rho [Mycolicibacterium litorale]MCV7414607.1 transcription termination factor Rho [Mycolicibacterium litorale]TDY00898.1 transcription termination factor Rho [Mycolicibacterium litorale]BBY14796.1 hypothetical protein MLIT_03880 [Mycolicibacterium litorale]
MTDTDLFTADSAELPSIVTTDPSPAAVTTTTAETAPTADVASGNRASLTSMVLPELRALARQIGVEGASGMRKSELIAAIRERRGDGKGNGAKSEAAKSDTAADTAAAPQTPPRRERRSASRQAGAAEAKTADKTAETPAETATETTAATAVETPVETKAAPPEQPAAEPKADRPRSERTRADKPAEQPATEQPQAEQSRSEQQKSEPKGDQRRADRPKTDQSDDRSDGDQRQGNRNDRNSDRDRNNSDDDEDGDGRGGRRGRRFRDRRRRGERGSESGGGDTEIRDDDVVQPVAGILDVLDNYAFVRTSGYLPGPNDVYVSMNMVRKNGLRRGDAVTGAVKVPKDGEQPNQRQKFNPLVRLDSINGGPVEDARKRPEFGKLTPLYPNQRLRLETSPDKLTTRVIDLIMPIGKGQRALIVSPPKAGKTTIMQDIANAITRNNPECHLMVVLVDERPEEVTDMTRSVKGEVIASTFDRPPSDHTTVAELAIERAKRLVEQGKDVVVLLDSITRLGRAYNNASPASGRILSGGVDSTALYPPKRFLGAARNIEEGGSLTIVATAMVETGSTGDTVIFEEFKGTGNAELKLDRKIAERRVFPAVDVNPSGTRKDELLLGPDEFAIVHKLRRVLSGLDSHQAIDLLMSQLRKTKTNYEFLVQVSKTAPGSADND